MNEKNLCKSECTNTPNCEPHGECVEDAIGGLSCDCEDEWIGDDCSTPSSFHPYTFWEPESVSQCEDPPVLPAEPDPNNPGEVVDIQPKALDYCPNDLIPILSETYCPDGYEADPFVDQPGAPCPIIGFKRFDGSELAQLDVEGCEDPDDPQQGGAAEEVEYCEEITQEISMPPDRFNRPQPTRIVRSYRKLESDELPGDDPAYEKGYRCEEVPENPYCCPLLNGNLPQTCVGLAADPDGSACEQTSDCAKGVCVEETCQSCSQFVECPDDAPPNGQNMPDDPEHLEVGMVHNFSADVDVGLVLDQLDLPEIPDANPCDNNGCRVSKTGVSRDLELYEAIEETFGQGGKSLSEIAGDVFSIDACQWRQSQPKLPNSDIGVGVPSFGQVEDPPEGVGDKPAYWTHTKGNDRFNVFYEAGISQSAELNATLADGAPFTIAADARFKLASTVWDNEIEIIGTEAGGNAHACGWGVETDFRLLGRSVSFGQVNLKTMKGSEPAKEQKCQESLDKFVELREQVNDAMNDVQSALDFYQAFGEDALDDVLAEADALNDTVSDRKQVLLDRYQAAQDTYAVNLKEFTDGQDLVEDSFAIALPSDRTDVEDVEFVSAEVAYAVGPFRLGLEVSSTGHWGLDFQAGVGYAIDTDLNPSLNGYANIAPSIGADVQAKLFVGIGNRFVGADAGATVELDLITIGFPIVAEMKVYRETISQSESNARFGLGEKRTGWFYSWGFGAGVVVKALSGNVDLFVRVRALIASKTWKKNVTSWDGIRKILPLYGNVVLDNNGDETLEPQFSEAVSLGEMRGMVSFPKLNFDFPDASSLLDLDFYAGDYADLRTVMSELGKPFDRADPNIPDKRCNIIENPL